MRSITSSARRFEFEFIWTEALVVHEFALGSFGRHAPT